jgi:hypothetical protein
MNSYGVLLLSNASATGSPVAWAGGRGLFSAEATFGGGSVGLEYRGPAGGWLAAPAVSLTAAGGVIFELPPCEIRAAVVTATGVYARADRIPA